MQLEPAQGLNQAKATHLTCTQSKSHDLMGAPARREEYFVWVSSHAFPFEAEPKSNLFGHSDAHKIFVAWARLGIF